MVIDIKVSFIFSTCLKTLRSCGLVVNDRVDGKGNHEDETMEFRDIMITSVRIIGLLLLLAGVLLLLLHLDDVMNLNVITHIETVEHLNVPNISTAHHTPPLMKNILTEVIHHDVTNLHGLLHVIVLAILSVVDHQHT